MKRLLFLLAIILVSCKGENSTITQVSDYNGYLKTSSDKSTSKFFELWNSKITQDSTEVLSFGNVASEYYRFFTNTGNISFLKKAESALNKAVEKANINKASYARALARNYISQHRFKEALKMAKLAQSLGEGKKATQQLFFDVHMELGNYKEAEDYLDKIKNINDFQYLIRAAKWSDYKGDLDTTILLMEKALAKAESANNRNLKLWSYTNLADYYGHAGKIEDSYQFFLKALQLDPKNAYAKKGIAWIIYSHEKNGLEALRILNSITETYHAPDYDVLKAEIHEFMGNDALSKESLNAYRTKVNNSSYGVMYNTYSVDYYLEHSGEYKKALEIALQELSNRPTPESYNLLAKTYLQLGKTKEALKIVTENIEGKTFEPEVLLNNAQIYKANGKTKKVAQLKAELLEAAYELGPIAYNTITAL